MLLALAAVASVAAPRPGDLKTFRDWIVGCDNGRACQAVGLMPEGDHEAATTTVKRAAEAGAAPDIWITAREKRPAAVRIDGRSFALAAEPGDETIYRPSDAKALLAALAAARRAELVDAGGRRLGALSTSGASAALLYMDEAQRRIGTVTALVRRGGKPASEVPAPPPLPQIAEVRPPNGPAPKRSLPPARLRRLKAKSDCSADLPLNDHPVESRPLDARTTLFLVPCWIAAYNSGSLVLVARKPDASDLQPALFDHKGAPAERRGALVPPEGAYWDEEAGRLASAFKGRGLGDCGVVQDWAWDGTKFRLIREDAMSECRGSTDYITTWRARVK